MNDPTEQTRMEMLAAGQPHADLIDTVLHGERTWSTQELTEEFEVLGFMAPFVIVRRRSDGKKGSMEFTHSPRVYFGFQEDTE